MFGHEPRHWGITATNACSIPALQTWLDERTLIQELLQQHLQRARLRMKQQADKRRSERTFEVGDMVFLKLQPYVQTSVAKRANHKLSFRYYGPYEIVAKINEVAYKLALPAHASVHPVFHVSMLRRAVLPGTQVQQTLPTPSDVPAVPAAVLDTRWRRKRGAMVEQVLVRWSDPAAIADTWEDKQELQARFPEAEAWGQASSQEGGGVKATGRRAPATDSLPDPYAPRPSRQRRPNPKVHGPEWV